MTGPAPWRIQVDSAARRGLHRLPAKVAAAVIEFTTGPLAENPERLSKTLRDELAGHRSGDYRVLIRGGTDAHTVLAVRIDHRADVHRP